jgi:ferredoxin
MITFSMSSWAGSIVPCTQEGEPLPIQKLVDIDIHVHHGNVQHNTVAQSAASTTDGCVCCDECESMCPVSASSFVAITSQSVEISFAGNKKGNSLPYFFHATLDRLSQLAN